MITDENLKGMVTLLEAYIQETLEASIKVIRKEQNKSKPNYPYGAYKVTMDSKVADHQAGVVKENAYDGDGAIDPTKVKIKKRKMYSSYLSIEFYDTSWANSRQLADVCHEYFDSKVGLDQMRTLYLTPKILSDVNDRTIVLDGTNEYEYRFGFDIRLDKYKVSERLEPVLNPASFDDLELNKEEL
jgi:hypothetical protein